MELREFYCELCAIFIDIEPKLKKSILVYSFLIVSVARAKLIYLYGLLKYYLKMLMSIDPEKIIGKKISRDSFVVTPLASTLYAIGIGFSSDNLNLEDLKFTYEKHKDFAMFPTIIGSSDIGLIFDQFNAIGISPPHRSKLLHAEQIIEINKPIPIGVKIGNSLEFVDVADK